jgi:hypothetical protein
MSKKKHKQQHSPTYSDVPLSPVPRLGDPTADEKLREYRKRYDAAQKELAEAPIKKAEAELTQTIRELDKHARCFWPQSIEAIIPRLYTEASQDFGLSGVPDATEQNTPDDLKAAIASWFDRVLPTMAYGFVNENAAQKFGYYLSAAAYHMKDVRSPAAITACFLRLVEIEAFKPGELSFDPSKAPRKQPAPAPKPTLADIEKLSAESTEGRRKVLAIVEDLASSQAADMASQWLLSLKTNFNFVPNDDQIKQIVGWFQKNGKNWLSPRSYDEARRWAVSAYIFPENLLTSDEALCKSLEAIPLGTLGYDERTRLYNKLQRQRD